MIQCDLVPIRQLLIGDLQPFGPHGEPSGIDKQPVSGALTAGPTGLAGDRQADLRHHGGPDKAIHHYPAEHYLAWQATGLPLDPARLQPDGFGENISTTGLTEQTVCIGDVFRAGSIVLQVAQARQPCWKLGIRFGWPELPLQVQASGRTGWYYRVLEAGTLAAGDSLQLLQRPHPDWPLVRLLHVLYDDVLNQAALAQMADLAVLAESWRVIARRRLETGQVEEWERRLRPPAG